MSETAVSVPGTPARGGAREGSGRRKGSSADPATGGGSRVDRSEMSEYREELDAELKILGEAGLTYQVVRERAMLGLAGLTVMARRGHIRCMMYLVDRLMGSPERSYGEAVAATAGAELRLELLQSLIGVDLPPIVAALVAEKLAGPADEGEVELVTQALPPPG